MAKSSQRAHPEGTNARNRLVRRPTWGVARPAAPELSRTARARLAMVDWHRAHGANVSLTARHFGVARPTVYRWLARFDRSRLETLENRSSAPAAGGAQPGPLSSSGRCGRSGSATPAGARTSSSSCSAGMASACRAR